jgi:hypothetical protein
MPKQNQPEENRPEHRLDFFRPDQVAFLVTHGEDAIDPYQGDRLRNDVLIKWRASIEGLLNNTQTPWRFEENQPISSYSFPAVASDRSQSVPDGHRDEEFRAPFSLIRITLQNLENPSDTDEERIKTKRSLLDLIKILNDQTRIDDYKPAGLTVRGVFPNWVASSSPPNNSDSGGTGGPGGRPSAYNGDPEQIPFYFSDLIAKLEGANKTGTNIYGDGDGVDVIILDTAPCAHDLVLAYKELVLVPERQTRKGHPLLKNLLGPGGRLKVYPATYEEHLRMGNTSLNKHGYKMDDHGLFIAGVIHSIVPKATIHLIEVLNQFGVGDLESIASGLAKAFAISRQSRSRKLVVNFSIGLEMPDPKKVNAYLASNDETIRQFEKEFEEFLREEMILDMDEQKAKPENHSKRREDVLFWVFALRVMCERLDGSGWQVIAAAGNDSKKENGQRNARGARYPAAFTRVVGVGAMPKTAKADANGRYEASSFSNLADKPPQTGIMALGGEEGENNGLLGIYLGEFPLSDAEVALNNHPGWNKPGNKSRDGLGWWAGTSFATPVLTGVIASVLTRIADPATTQAALQLLYDEYIVEESLTAQQEDAMPSSLGQYVPTPAQWP